MQTQVAIIMGSDSDWPILKKAAETLASFGVSYDVQVMSAHRTPERVHEYVTKTAVENGTEKKYRAGAGCVCAASAVWAWLWHIQIKRFGGETRADYQRV